MFNLLTVSQTDVVEQVKLSLTFPSMLREVLIRKTINQIAEEKGITAELEELQEAADALRRSLGLLKETDTYTWLHYHQISIDDFEEIVQTKIVTEKLAEHLFAETVESFFAEHQQAYTQAVVYEALLDDRDAAMELFYALEEDEISFAEIARQHHPDPEIRRRGGYVGKLNHRDRPSEIADAIFAANPPEVLKPIVTARGVYLILVEEIIRPELNNSLRQQILAQRLSDWLNLQLENTTPEIHIV